MSNIQADCTDKDGTKDKHKICVPGSCVFPFKYYKKDRFECVDGDRGAWCATSLNEDGTRKTYAYCPTKQVVEVPKIPEIPEVVNAPVKKIIKKKKAENVVVEPVTEQPNEHIVDTVPVKKTIKKKKVAVETHEKQVDVVPVQLAVEEPEIVVERGESSLHAISQRQSSKSYEEPEVMAKKPLEAKELFALQKRIIKKKTKKTEKPVVSRSSSSHKSKTPEKSKSQKVKSVLPLPSPPQDVVPPSPPNKQTNKMVIPTKYVEQSLVFPENKKKPVAAKLVAEKVVAPPQQPHVEKQKATVKETPEKKSINVGENVVFKKSFGGDPLIGKVGTIVYKFRGAKNNMVYTVQLTDGLIINTDETRFIIGGDLRNQKRMDELSKKYIKKVQVPVVPAVAVVRQHSSSKKSSSQHHDDIVLPEPVVRSSSKKSSSQHHDVVDVLPEPVVRSSSSKKQKSISPPVLVPELRVRSKSLSSSKSASSSSSSKSSKKANVTKQIINTNLNQKRGFNTGRTLGEIRKDLGFLKSSIFH